MDAEEAEEGRVAVEEEAVLGVLTAVCRAVGAVLLLLPPVPGEQIMSRGYCVRTPQVVTGRPGHTGGETSGVPTGV